MIAAQALVLLIKQGTTFRQRAQERRMPPGSVGETFPPARQTLTTFRVLSCSRRRCDLPPDEAPEATSACRPMAHARAGHGKGGATRRLGCLLV